MNIYVRDLTSEKVKTLRAIRQRHFGTHQPASTLVGTTALVHEELMLEIEAIAVIAITGVIAAAHATLVPSMIVPPGFSFPVRSAS